MEDVLIFLQEEEEEDPEGPESEWRESSSVCERAEQCSAETLPQTLVPEVPNMSPGEKGVSDVRHYFIRHH